MKIRKSIKIQHKAEAPENNSGEKQHFVLFHERGTGFRGGGGAGRGWGGAQGPQLKVKQRTTLKTREYWRSPCGSVG